MGLGARLVGSTLRFFRDPRETLRDRVDEKGDCVGRAVTKKNRNQNHVSGGSVGLGLAGNPESRWKRAMDGPLNWSGLKGAGECFVPLGPS